jgi:Trk-type K+ transport system membrane component
VLAIALMAQQYASDPDSAMIGWFIITSGMGIVGFYAARESRAPARKQGMRAGAIAGLIVGIFLALAFVAITIVRSLNPTLFAEVERMVVTAYPEQTLRDLTQLGWTPRALAQLVLLMGVMCCGIGLPLLSVLLGAMGGFGAAIPDDAAP